MTTKTSRRRFLRRAAVVPLAGAALALGMKAQPEKLEGGVLLNLSHLIPADGEMHTIDVKVRGRQMPRANYTPIPLYLDYAAFTVPRAG